MNFYVTTSIPYVNGDPHIGFAMELLMADALARNARAQGKPTIFSTGTDEHGSKNFQKAAELGITPKQFVDQISGKFRDLQELLNTSADRFVRTTDKAHEQRAQIIWKNLEHDIYKSKYVGWYDVKEEEFVPENRADPARMKPDHPQAYQRLEEENYFFKLSGYTDMIRQAIETNTMLIVPDTRRNEVLSLLKEGLEDISVSRPKDKLNWGVPVPGDDTQVMYVWFEALMNYLTVLGYPEHQDFKDFWPANVQVIGKDIIRFHCAIWPGMLFSIGLPLPKMIYAHGFITVDDRKMSKSYGNGIAPKEIIDKFGVDAFRYYFLRHIPSYNDGDFSWGAFESAYNHELADDLGNALQRTVALIMKHLSGVIGDIPVSEHDNAPIQQAIDQCRFDRAIEHIWDQVRGLNQYIDEEKPWEIAKGNDSSHLRDVLAYQVSCLLEIAEMLAPFLPETAEKIQAVFKDGIAHPLKVTLFPKKQAAEDATAAANQ